MGFFSEEMAPMLGVFEAETTELITAIDGIIARVEHDNEFSAENIAELFRCAHTIKGSSAMMGLDDLSLLTHRAEDLFSLLRDNPALANDRVPDLLDHLYSFSDFVRDELGRMSDDDYVPGNPSDLIKGIVADVEMLGGDSGEDAENNEHSATAGQEVVESIASDEKASQKAHGSGSDVTLKVKFKADVPMVNARAMVIVKQLRSHVQSVYHVPEDLTSASAAKAISEDGLLVKIDENDVENAKQFLAKSSFVRRIIVLDEAAPLTDAPETVSEKKAEEPSTPSAEKYVTLRWDSIRELQNMAGEFLTQTARIKLLSADLPDGSELRSEIAHANRLVQDLVYDINTIAMVNMSAMVPQLSRMVRDMCRASGKQISFEVHGGDIQVDRNLYNSISDPLLHIIRNSVDHGIELPEERLANGKEGRGKITLTIENLGARVAFTVADDGRGIDTEKVLEKAEASGSLKKPVDEYTHSEILQLVMLPGLSTSSEITQYSGRGVGMDVVSTLVHDFNGSVEIESEAGQGTSTTLLMPVSVTSVDSLGFTIGHFICHMPLFNLDKIFVADEVEELLSQFEGSVLFTYKKREVPVLDMHRLLDCQGENKFYIVCHSMQDEFVIGVDDVIGEFSCANKPLPSCLGAEWQTSCAIRNSALMDDKMVGYALNAALLARLAQGRERSFGQMEKDAENETNFEVISVSDIPARAFVFTLGDERYAIPVEAVERLVPMPEYSETPRAVPYLLGLANHRSNVYPIFDLAKSAGVSEECAYVLIMIDSNGEYKGLTITSALAVRDMENAVLAEEQPEFRTFAGGLRSAALLTMSLKEPPITLLTRY